MFVRGLVGAVIGMFAGAGAGALTLGWDASMFVGSSPLGPTRDWWPLSALAGALGGAVFGLALGLYVSLARVEALPSAIAGGGVGVIGAAAMLFIGEDLNYWRFRSLPSHVAPLALSVLLWTLIGLLLSALGKLSNAGRV